MHIKTDMSDVLLTITSGHGRTERMSPEQARATAEILQRAADEAEAWLPPLSDETKAQVRDVLIDNLRTDPPLDHEEECVNQALVAVAAGLGITIHLDEFMVQPEPRCDGSCGRSEPHAFHFEPNL